MARAIDSEMKRIENFRGKNRHYYWDLKGNGGLARAAQYRHMAELIINCALQRPWSCGRQSILDYPGQDEERVQCDTELQCEMRPRSSAVIG